MPACWWRLDELTNSNWSANMSPGGGHCSDGHRRSRKTIRSTIRNRTGVMEYCDDNQPWWVVFKFLVFGMLRPRSRPPPSNAWGQPRNIVTGWICLLLQRRRMQIRPLRTRLEDHRYCCSWMQCVRHIKYECTIECHLVIGARKYVWPMFAWVNYTDTAKLPNPSSAVTAACSLSSAVAHSIPFANRTLRNASSGVFLVTWSQRGL